MKGWSYLVRGSYRNSIRKKLINYWSKFRKLFFDNFINIYSFKDIIYFKLPGFDKKQVINILAKEINNCNSKSKPLTILIIEIDHYKHYIETFGFEAGKNIINTIKDIIDRKTRGSDLCFCDEMGKFIILLPEAVREEVLNIAVRVRDIVTKQGYSPFDGAKQIKIKLTVSIGSAYTNCNEGNTKIEVIKLLKRAKFNLLEGKKKGINQINLSD